MQWIEDGNRSCGLPHVAVIHRSEQRACVADKARTFFLEKTYCRVRYARQDLSREVRWLSLAMGFRNNVLS